jgi:hypothetical protein
MFIAPNSAKHCFVRKSGQTAATGYDGLSAPPNEAGGGKGLRAINMLPVWGKAVLPISEQSLRVLKKSKQHGEAQREEPIS